MNNILMLKNKNTPIKYMASIQRYCINGCVSNSCENAENHVKKENDEDITHQVCENNEDEINTSVETIIKVESDDDYDIKSDKSSADSIVKNSPRIRRCSIIGCVSNSCHNPVLNENVYPEEDITHQICENNVDEINISKESMITIESDDDYDIKSDKSNAGSMVKKSYKIRRCCIIGCLSNSRQNPQLVFFRFPSPGTRLHRIWKKACCDSMKRILSFKYPVICRFHFAHYHVRGRKRLTPDAIPSLRLEVKLPSNLKKVQAQERNTLSPADRLQVIRDYEITPRYVRLARKFNCSSAQIKNIILNKEFVLQCHAKNEANLEKNEINSIQQETSFVVKNEISDTEEDIANAKNEKIEINSIQQETSFIVKNEISDVEEDYENEANFEYIEINSIQQESSFVVINEISDAEEDIAQKIDEKNVQEIKSDDDYFVNGDKSSANSRTYNSRTVRRCCIFGCDSNSRQSKKLAFFSFPPLESPLHNLWKDACYASMHRILNLKNPIVCTRHFSSNCFKGRKRLTSNAIPSLLLNVKSPSKLKIGQERNILSQAERVQVIRRYEDTPSYNALAREFNCSCKQIKNIIANKKFILECHANEADFTKIHSNRRNLYVEKNYIQCEQPTEISYMEKDIALSICEMNEEKFSMCDNANIDSDDDYEVIIA